MCATSAELQTPTDAQSNHKAKVKIKVHALPILQDVVSCDRQPFLGQGSRHMSHPGEEVAKIEVLGVWPL